MAAFLPGVFLPISLVLSSSGDNCLLGFRAGFSSLAAARGGIPRPERTEERARALPLRLLISVNPMT